MSPVSDIKDGSHARNICWLNSVAGMFGSRAVGSGNVDDADADRTDRKMSTALTVILSWDAASERTGHEKPN